MSLTSALETDLDKFNNLITRLFPALAHSSGADHPPEVIIQTIFELNEKIQQKVDALVQRINTYKRMFDLAKQVQLNSIRINGFINGARALEDAIFCTISEAPRIRGSVSTSALYATSVTVEYTPNTIPMIDTQDSNTMQDEIERLEDQKSEWERLETKAQELLDALQKPTQEPSLAVLLRQAETASETTFPPVGAFSNVPMPSTFVIQPEVSPTSSTLATLSPAEFLSLIRTKDPKLGYK